MLDLNSPLVIRPYVHDDLPGLDLSVADVTIVDPERTYWTKSLYYTVCGTGMSVAANFAVEVSVYLAITLVSTSEPKIWNRTASIGRGGKPRSMNPTVPDEGRLVQVSTVFGASPEFLTMALIGSDRHFALDDFEFITVIAAPDQV
jgi:hypothetical protein